MKKQCKKCRQFKLIEDIFGYCRRYDEQALITENCKEIKEIHDYTQTRKKPTLKSDSET